MYIWYYAISADTPQWAAIWISVAMGIANIFGLIALWVGRSKISIPRHYKDVYDLFNILPPGDFRKLMSVARRESLPAGSILTTDQDPVRWLYFVINGSIRIEKFGDTFHIRDNMFIGEVGYLTGNTASATTMLETQSDVLVWEVALLHKKSARDPRFKLALDALISLDLANKVALAGRPQNTPEIKVLSNMLREDGKVFSHEYKDQPLHLGNAASN
ncbi:MAG: cyclic nucleotide-binding domain-containing protein [Paracoccaceae bacterium]